MFNVFYILGYFSIISVILVILSPTPVHSVLFGICFYIFFGSMLVYVGYDLAGLILILVYAGALMVMFLFVVMAFNLTRDLSVYGVRAFYVGIRQWGRAVIVAAVFFLFLRTYRYVWIACVGLNYYRTVFPLGCRADFYNVIVSGCPTSNSFINEIGVVFYQGFSVPLLLCGILIIVGLVGSVSLAGIFRMLHVKRRDFPVFVRRVRSDYRIVVLR